MSTPVCNVTKQDMLSQFRQKISTMDFSGEYMGRLKQSLMSVTDSDIEIGEYISITGQQATLTVEYEAEGLKVNSNLGTVQSKSKQGVKQYKIVTFDDYDRNDLIYARLNKTYRRQYGIGINHILVGTVVIQGSYDYPITNDINYSDGPYSWKAFTNGIAEYEAREYFDKLNYKVDTAACTEASIELNGDKFECGGWPINLHFVDPEGVAQTEQIGTVMFDIVEGKPCDKQKLELSVNKFTFKDYKDKQDKANGKKLEEEEQAKNKAKQKKILIIVAVVVVISIIYQIATKF